jgi:hypothetical protein
LSHLVYRHLVLATGEFSISPNSTSPISLQIVGPGSRVLARRFLYHHFRMTLMLRVAGHARMVHSIFVP